MMITNNNRIRNSMDLSMLRTMVMRMVVTKIMINNSINSTEVIIIQNNRKNQRLKKLKSNH